MVQKVVGCVMIGKWYGKNPKNQSSVLSLAISKIWPAGIFMNFCRISAHWKYGSGTSLLVMMKCYDIAARLLQLLSHTAAVPGVIFAAHLPGLIAYIIYNRVRAYIIKIIEIKKYFTLKILNLKVKYFFIEYFNLLLF